MNRILEYETCSPYFLTHEELKNIDSKFDILDDYIYGMVFHKPIFSDNNMVMGEETYLIGELKTKITNMTVNLDWAIDEFYIEFEEPIEISKGGKGIPNKSKSIHVEVVTKEVAESNDSDFGATSEDGYEVGGTNSYYTQIGDTDFYYREM